MLSQKQNRFGGKNLNAKKIVKIAKVFDKEATGSSMKKKVKKVCIVAYMWLLVKNFRENKTGRNKIKKREK